MNFFLIIFVLFTNNQLEKAKELYQKGIYLEAIYYLNNYLEKNPHDKEAQTLKKKIFLELNLTDSLSQNNNPSFISRKRKKGDQLIKKPGITYLDTLLKAKKAKEEGDYFKSLIFYEAFLKKDTTDKKIFYEVAQVASWLGFLNKAVFYYEKYLRYFPEDKKALYELGLTYSWNGNYEKALAILDSLEKETSDVKISLTKAKIYEWQGNYLNAYKIYQQLKNLYPESEDIAQEMERLKKIINKTEEKKDKFLKYAFLPLFAYQQTNEGWQRFLLKSSCQFVENKLTSSLFYEWQQCREKESLRIINKIGLNNKINLSEEVSLNLNIHYLAIKKSADIILYGCGVDYENQKLAINLAYNKKPIWEEVYKINTCYNLLTSDELFGFWAYRPFDFLGFEGGYRYAFYRDENELNNGNFRFFFLFMNNLKCGYEYHFLGYHLQKEEYWSPKFYEVHSLFLNIFNENWEAFFKLGKPMDHRFLEKNIAAAFKIKLVKTLEFLISGRYSETYYYKIGEISFNFSYLW